MLVLHIDDEQRSLDYVKTVLLEHDYDLISVTKSAEALIALQRNHIDAMIIDYLLSGEVTGLSLMTAIRKKYPDTALIMLSEHAGVDEVAEAYDNGVDKFLSKPVSPSILIEAIGAVGDVETMLATALTCLVSGRWAS